MVFIILSKYIFLNIHIHKFKSNESLDYNNLFEQKVTKYVTWLLFIQNIYANSQNGIFENKKRMYEFGRFVEHNIKIIYNCDLS